MNDLRFIWRQALAKPLFAGLIVGVLALGIGATSAIFSLTDLVLFKPLNFDEPERVVSVFRAGQDGEPAGSSVSHPAFTDLRDHARSFSHVAVYTSAPLNLAMPGHEPIRASGAVVSGDYFDLLGVPPLLGRALAPADDLDRNAHPVAVISEQAWRTRFGGDPDAVGREIRINSHPFTIVGVMPAHFRGTAAAGRTDVWLPLAMLEQAQPTRRWDEFDNRGWSWLQAMARLAPGVTAADAQAEIDALAAAIAEDIGRDVRWMRLALVPAADSAADPYGTGSTTRNAMLLLAVAFTLLFIAMTNAAGLLLVRTEERSREFALRLGIGAPRARVLRMLLVEALVYAAAGAALGLLLAWMVVSAALPSLNTLLHVMPTDPAQLISARVLAFGTALAVASALVAVLSPALRVARIDVNTALKQGGRSEPGTAANGRDALVVGQVMLTVALLAVALLLTRSFWQTAVIDPGFDPRGALVASVDPLRQGYTRDQSLQMQQALVERLEQHPRVVAAAFATLVPVGGGNMVSSFERPGRGEPISAGFNAVSTSYFRAMGIPLLRGRALSPDDRNGAPLAVVINRAFAEEYFAGEDPLGQAVVLLGPEPRTIVGIVANNKQEHLRERDQPLAFVPLAQWDSPVAAQARIVVRGHADDRHALSPVLRDAVRAIDPTMPVFGERTLAEHVGASYRESTVMAWLLSAFAAVAAALSAAGLYGLLSWQVRTRTREIGIRLAIGANAATVCRQFLRRGVTLAVIGIPLGLLAAAWVGRALDALLYGVAPHDPVTLVAVAIGFLVIALLATWAPARRSSRVSPMDALRDE